MLPHFGEVASKHVSGFTLIAKSLFPEIAAHVRTVVCFNEAHAL